jgi:hypothetical protein
MSNSLEFSINAKDNTSKVVDTVNKKINNFGSDLAKMALGVAGPMALVQAGISAIGNAIEEYKQKVAEAIKFGAELPNQAKALNISVEEYQRLGSAADAAGVGINEVAQAYVEVRKAIDAAKDPTSSQAAALKALGFAAEDISAGVVKPIEVIERLGRAMATGADDATQFKIASGLLGSSVEKLIPILRKAQEATQGYTDAGDVLTEEEAAILREDEMNTKKKELQDKVQKAREKARDKIVENPERFKSAIQSLFPNFDAQATINETFGGNSVQADLEMGKRGYSRGINKETGRSEYFKNLVNLTDEEKDLIIKERARQSQAAKQAEADAKAAADKEAADKLKAIADEAAAKKQKDKEAADAAKSEADKKKEAEKEAAKAAAEKKKEEDDNAKREKDELGKALDAEQKAREAASKFTGSSLRDIGGALAGEAITSGIDYQAATLDINQKILIELQKLNVKTLPEVPDTNFTKPGTSRGGTFVA